MPFYVVGGLPMHIKFGGGRKRPPAPCVARVGVADGQRQCRDISAYLCDWPLSDGKTCDAPLCAAHAREVGRNRHYCPRHHLQATQSGDAGAAQGPQLGLFTHLVLELNGPQRPARKDEDGTE